MTTLFLAWALAWGGSDIPVIYFETKELCEAAKVELVVARHGTRGAGHKVLMERGVCVDVGNRQSWR